MDRFVRLHDALRSLTADPSTAGDPIRRMFVCDGDHMSANVSILSSTDDAIHVQMTHDEIVVILEGECSFQVGDQTRRVAAGDLIFIPKDTVHGPIIDSGPIALLSVFAPHFDRSKANIRWARDDV